ncbi:TetR family transcriptional regulator [Microbacterium sp.]|uniref:TetR/AcrR family transcriptional regulator n=1 Tax=Microbacterium sp. TaxID=51671 RepID=UPI002811EEE0|nr:TetR family transcriptional regulator [Microbacterium sp.]
MARPKRQDARRADLVEAALTAVSERGLRSISLTDVAHRAGLTRGAILYYYSDLDELLVEAHRAGVERFCDARDDRIAGLDDPRDQLAVAIRAGLPDGPDDALMRLLYEFDILAGSSALHDELVETMYRRQLATYTGVLQRGLDRGLFSPQLDLPTFAMTLVALEDSYGLHIVGGNSLITVADAESAMRRVSERLGAPATEDHGTEHRGA